MDVDKYMKMSVDTVCSLGVVQREQMWNAQTKNCVFTVHMDSHAWHTMQALRS